MKLFIGTHLCAMLATVITGKGQDYYNYLFNAFFAYYIIFERKPKMSF